MCNFHKNQDRTFVRVLFWREGTGLFFEKLIVSYDTPCLIHTPLKKCENQKNWKSSKIFRLIFLNHLILIHESLRIDGSDKNIKAFHVKKRVLEEVSSRVMHRIRSETLGKTLGETFRAKESHRESWIGSYAWLSARLSPRLVFLRG